MKTKITNYIRRRVMQNAWQFFRRKSGGVKSFAEALRKAWRELIYYIRGLEIEGRDTSNLYAPKPQPAPAFVPLPVPDDYYGVAGRYYGD